MSDQPPYPPQQPAQPHGPGYPQYQPQYPSGQPPYGPHGPYPPLLGPGKRSWWSRQSTQAKVVIAASMALLLLVVVLVATNHSGRNSQSAAGSGHPRGGTDDWLAAVCEPGRFHNGTVWRNAIGGGSCSSVRNEGTRQTTIFFVQYSSQFMLENDLKMMHMQFYAVGEGDDGVISAFAVGTSATEPLEPLNDFGFKIESV